jgi:hypothetical protein
MKPNSRKGIHGGCCNFRQSKPEDPGDVYGAVSDCSAGQQRLGSPMRKLGVDPTGTRAAIPARADSAVEIKNGVAVDFRSLERLSNDRTMSYGS